MALSPTELARYGRHLPLIEIGVAGQEKLRAARVAGRRGWRTRVAGGLVPGRLRRRHARASSIATVWSLQPAATGAVRNRGCRVVSSRRRPSERLSALNPQITVVAHAVELRAANVLDVLGAYDVVLDGTDRLATRYVVNDACVLLRKPLVSAAIHRFEGQAMTYVPGRGPCYRCLFSDATQGIVPNCAEAGVLGVLPGVLGRFRQPRRSSSSPAWASRSSAGC